ncbi:MAG: phosphatase PAP2 family protein [Rhodococcus sp.]|nr:phosphatase PAP2 family protein [Rhodococcus sp. (in: high G+C Gram-positive bacteria)]
MIRSALSTSMVLAVLALAALPVRDGLFRAISGFFAGSALGSSAGFVAENGPYVLVATVAVLVVRLWVTDRRAFLTLGVAGVGVVTAYLSSELIKLVITEPRPCRALGITGVLDCPEVGDWSWPSNHSVIAASFATACVLAVPRIIWFVAPIAVVLGFSRVAAGVHYVHDVLSGLSLGVLTVTVVVAVALPWPARWSPVSRLLVVDERLD